MTAHGHGAHHGRAGRLPPWTGLPAPSVLLIREGRWGWLPGRLGGRRQAGRSPATVR